MPNLRTFRSTALMEAAASVDIDEHRWKPISASSDDFMLARRPRAIAIATRLFHSSPICRRVIQSHVDFIVGDGFQLTADQPEADAILREFWNAPEHAFVANLPIHVQELLLYGELCYLVKVSAGRVAVTFVPATYISDVIPDEGIPGRAAKLVIGEDEFSVITFKDGRYTGSAFFLAINRTADQVRGYPTILALEDWLSLWETYFMNKMEKQAITDAIWWDVTLEGMTQEQIDAWLRTPRANPPRPGSLIAHNEKVRWELRTSTGSAESAEFPSFVTNFILASAGLSSFNQQAGRGVRETGEVLDPVIRSLSARQAEVRAFYEVMGTFVVQEAQAAGLIPPGPVNVRCIAPRLGVRDIQRSSGALERITSSLSAAVESGWITPEEAGTVYRSLLISLGLAPDSMTLKTTGEP